MRKKRNQGKGKRRLLNRGDILDLTFFGFNPSWGLSFSRPGATFIERNRDF
jgi:hypothetical protein